MSKRNLPCLNKNKAAGMDRFSTKFLKKAADVLAYTSFAKITNLLVKLCVSPEECKIATLKTVLERLKDRLYFCL